MRLNHNTVGANSTIFVLGPQVLQCFALRKEDQQIREILVEMDQQNETGQH